MSVFAVTRAHTREEEALTFCNDVRAQLNRSPVKALRKGIPIDADQCVIANTINHGSRNRVVVDGVAVLMPVHDEDGELIAEDMVARLPGAVNQLVRDFDGDRFPELVGCGWAE